MSDNKTNPASFLLSAVAGAALLCAGFFAAVQFTGGNAAQATVDSDTAAVATNDDDNSVASTGDEGNDDNGSGESSNQGTNDNQQGGSGDADTQTEDNEQAQEPDEGDQANDQDEPGDEGGENKQDVPNEGAEPEQVSAAPDPGVELEPGDGGPIVDGQDDVAVPEGDPCKTLIECIGKLPEISFPMPEPGPEVECATILDCLPDDLAPFPTVEPSPGPIQMAPAAPTPEPKWIIKF